MNNDEIHTDIDQDEEDDSSWLITYADLSTLLLVFFVLLFSMSEINVLRFTDSFTSVRQALGEDRMRADTARDVREDGAILESVRLRQQLLESQRKVYSEVRTFMNRKGLEGVVGAVFDNGVITLRMPADVLFEPGRVQLTGKGQEAVLELMEFFIQHNDQAIHIKGFTDDQPPPEGVRFKDNWEISSMRAVNVLRLLLAEGIESNRLTATGMADLDPLFPNNTPDNMKRNRRVEFVLEKRISE